MLSISPIQVKRGPLEPRQEPAPRSQLTAQCHPAPETPRWPTKRWPQCERPAWSPESWTSEHPQGPGRRELARAHRSCSPPTARPRKSLWGSCLPLRVLGWQVRAHSRLTPQTSPQGWGRDSAHVSTPQGPRQLMQNSRFITELFTVLPTHPAEPHPHQPSVKRSDSTPITPSLPGRGINARTFARAHLAMPVAVPPAGLQPRPRQFLSHRPGRRPHSRSALCDFEQATSVSEPPLLSLQRRILSTPGSGETKRGCRDRTP